MRLRSRSQRGVRGQDGEVDRPERPRSRERDRAHIVVIDQVATKKHAGGGKRRQHDFPVRGDASPPNQEEAPHQQHGRRRVEGGVDGGKVVYRNHDRSAKTRLMSRTTCAAGSSSDVV